MPLKTHKLIFAPLAILLLTSSACGYVPIPDVLERTAPHEFFFGADSGAWCEKGDDYWTDEARHILGPHFTVDVACRFVGEELPAQVAARSSALADLPKAEDGSEFVVNQVSTTPMEAQYGYAPTRAWVTIGDYEFELREAPDPGDWVVLTAPADEQAVLWVEDTGRAQGVDMRTGERVDPVFAFYNGVSSTTDLFSGYRYEEVYFDRGADYTWLACEYDGGSAWRNPWDEELGWAEDGTVFLTVGTTWCRDFDEFTWSLDQRSIVLASGEAAEPVAWREAGLDGMGVEVYAVFEVPDYDAEFTIAFAPYGRVVDEQGREWEFRDDPATTEWEALF
ncbi:hypothetical protein ACFQS3_08675 [Glycomyces mayteni]|uniref:Uncharacterized protein n=1 Tax=Glycomyces mayteni TaxID=543887 RepID=A0ABW2D4M9_9ACTN